VRDVTTASTWNLGVLLSGTGRTLENLIAAIERGKLDARIPVVISSVPDVRGIDIAREAGIAAIVIRRGDYASVEHYSTAMYEAMAPYNLDLIVMAGYLRKLLIAPEWEGRVLNIHPCLLPEAASYAAGKGMYGERVHAAVLAHGDTVSGCTVHLVTNDFDAGPPLAKVEVPVLPDDTAATLGARVFVEETWLYPATIREYMQSHPELQRPAPLTRDR
jgi:phosphoribosylglycinamide formyltransferase-1